MEGAFIAKLILNVDRPLICDLRHAQCSLLKETEFKLAFAKGTLKSCAKM